MYLKVSAKAILGNEELKQQMRSKENAKKERCVHEHASGDGDENVLYVKYTHIAL